MIIAIRHSRRAQWIIAMVAMPLASMPLSASSSGIQIPVCSADGAVRSVTIPVDSNNGDQRDDHCAKPCHACLNRKKPVRNR